MGCSRAATVRVKKTDLKIGPYGLFFSAKCMINLFEFLVSIDLFRCEIHILTEIKINLNFTHYPGHNDPIFRCYFSPQNPEKFSFSCFSMK